MNKSMLGRIASPTDVRDHNFLLAPPKTRLVRKSWVTNKDEMFDQGQTPQCVAYAACHYLLAEPVRNNLPYPTIGEFYTHVQKLDGMAMPHDGSTVRAAMKLLKQLGYVPKYGWAFSTSTITQQILTVGPVDVGTDWTNDMFQPDNHNFIHVGTKYDLAGGHSYLLSGVDTKIKCPDGSVGCFEITNSWGLGWGKKGKAFISIKDMGILMNHRGEAAAAVEISLAA